MALGDRIKLEDMYLDGMPGERVGAFVRAALVTPQTCPFLREFNAHELVGPLGSRDALVQRRMLREGVVRRRMRADTL